MRPGDLVARTGSDAFVILVDHVPGLVEATDVADRVREGLTRPFDLGGQEVFTTASIGITLSDAGYERAEDMLRDAEVAMHRAVARGGDRYELFDKTMHSRALARLRLETDLRRAVERREFRVHYQPIISLATGRIAGFEALARWQHPERGLLPPAEFIPVAEETGLIMPMSSQVFQEASAQVRAWQVEFEWDPPLKVSMNFTSTQFTESEVESTIIAAFKSSGLDGKPGHRRDHRERDDQEHRRRCGRCSRGSKVFGIEVHVDDFGTGYSSLSYLHRLPVDALKVDRSFVGRLPGDEDADVLVRTIVDLAHHLGMQVVAEGIETRAQLERLRDAGLRVRTGLPAGEAQPASDRPEAAGEEPRLVGAPGGKEIPGAHIGSDSVRRSREKPVEPGGRPVPGAFHDTLEPAGEAHLGATPSARLAVRRTRQRGAGRGACPRPREPNRGPPPRGGNGLARRRLARA